VHVVVGLYWFLLLGQFAAKEQNLSVVVMVVFEKPFFVDSKRCVTLGGNVAA
jgi:hypothetical protein